MGFEVGKRIALTAAWPHASFDESFSNMTELAQLLSIS